MRYSATSKNNRCATKIFEDLQEAIEWTNKQKTKLGHRIEHFEVVTTCTGEKIGRVIIDYETFGNK